MNCNNAVFLDRDGTINVEKNYLYKIDDFEYLDGVKEGLRILQNAGFKLIIVTNQSGIARGYYGEEDYKKLEKWMLDDLEKSGIHITASYYCPHHPDAKVDNYRIDCACRKPKLGMYEKAIMEHNIELDGSVAIGDKLRDLAICCKPEIENKVQGYLLYSELKEERENIHYVKGGIFEAAKMIVNKRNEI